MSPIRIATVAPQTRLAARAHFWLNRMLLGGIAIQFYTVALAALGISGFTAHALLGWSMIAVALLSVIAASLSRIPLATLTVPVLALALVIAQPVLASIPRTVFPVIYALHALNAVIVLLLVLRVEQQARAHTRQLSID
jgi:hypothetical protein